MFLVTGGRESNKISLKRVLLYVISFFIYPNTVVIGFTQQVSQVPVQQVQYRVTKYKFFWVIDRQEELSE